MNKKSPVAIFIAATTIISSGAIQPSAIQAGENHQDMGGLKEWTTDQEIDAESTLDSAAADAAKKAKEEDICIPIGEGENCW